MSHTRASIGAKERLLAIAIPFVSALCAFWCAGLALTAQLSLLEYILTVAGAIVSASLAIWYILAAFYLVFFFLYHREQNRRSTLPGWLPGIMRNLAVGTLSLSIYVAPASAAETVPSASISVTSTESEQNPSLHHFYKDAQDLSHSQKKLLSSFFSQEHAQDKHNQQVTERQWTETEPLVYQHTAHHADTTINPLFTQSPRHNLLEDSATKMHTVTRGESLWTIAQAHLPATATDTDIMELVSAIYSVNSFQLPLDENLIHPGQELLIPIQ